MRLPEAGQDRLLSWWRGEGRHKACPYRGGLGGDCAGGGARAGTRPAPTGGVWAEIARVAGRGQARGLPLPGGFGRRRRGWRGEGRHKGGVWACPYRGGLGGDCAGGGARAGTRPAPTGGVWAETARVAGRGQARGLPLPGGFGRRLRGWRGEGRHEACPYRGGLGGDCAGGGARAGTRPAPTGGVWAETARVAGRGQARGLPLPGGFGRRLRGWRGEGRHEACPYRGGLGGNCAGGGARAGTRPAPTGRFGGKGRRIWQSGHNCAIIYALQEVQYFRTSFQTQTYRRYQCSEASF